MGTVAQYPCCKMLIKFLILAVAIATTHAASFQSHLSVGKEEFTCEECVRELAVFGRMCIKAGPELVEYLQIAWCPAQHTGCDGGIQNAYPRMLDNIIIHFFLDGAIASARWRVCVQSKRHKRLSGWLLL